VWTNRASGARFKPFGDEVTSTSNDREKFATYTRDSYTGLDYADQRYYASTYGRFNTPDRYQASAGPSDPGSWNRYSYTRGDPVNRLDPSGRDDCDAYYDFCDDTFDYGYDDSGAPIQQALDYGNWGGSGCTYAEITAFGNGGVPFLCAGGGVTGAALYPIAQQSSSPTCLQTLTSQVGTFLQNQAPALLGWDPNLAAQAVAVGFQDNVDPRLMVSIAALESGNGSVFGGNNNPFGLGPGRNYGSPAAAVSAEGITLKHLIGYGDTTVATLYSGLPGIPDGHRGFAQVPGYCQTSVAACQAAGGTISGFLGSFAASSTVGLTAGNPNKLGFPCPY
jgi:RHS repeat-associated protein